MTSSSSPPLERGLDTMLLVYSLLQGHPASPVCEQFLRSRGGWFAPVLVLFEAKAILTKVYGVDAALASQKLAQVAAGPCTFTPVDEPTALAALTLADVHGLGLTDAVLLQTVLGQGASCLATEDQQLAKVCRKVAITTESPFDAALRQQVAAWENANLPSKGLPRVLRLIHRWLGQHHPQAAADFDSQTGGGSHLP